MPGCTRSRSSVSSRSPAGHTVEITCLAGERRCPPEDVGGPWGYQEFMHAIADPKHEEHHCLDWCGGSFDPEESAVEAVNLERGKLGRWSRPRR